MPKSETKAQLYGPFDVGDRRARSRRPIREAGGDCDPADQAGGVVDEEASQCSIRMRL